MENDSSGIDTSVKVFVTGASGCPGLFLDVRPAPPLTEKTELGTTVLIKNTDAPGLVPGVLMTTYQEGGEWHGIVVRLDSGFEIKGKLAEMTVFQ